MGAMHKLSDSLKFQGMNDRAASVIQTNRFSVLDQIYPHNVCILYDRFNTNLQNDRKRDFDEGLLILPLGRSTFSFLEKMKKKKY